MEEVIDLFNSNGKLINYRWKFNFEKDNEHIFSASKDTI